MWEFDHEEGSALKNWCFWTVVLLEKTLESPLESKEIQPVHPKGDQSRVFIGRTYAKAETPILWPPDVKSWLIGKDPDAGRDWVKRRRGWQRMRWLDGITDLMDMSLSKLQEMVKDRVAWHAVGSPWVCKETDTTKWLNNKREVPPPALVPSMLSPPLPRLAISWLPSAELPLDPTFA